MVRQQRHTEDMAILRGIVEHRLIPLAERPYALQPEPVALSLGGLRQTGLR